MRYIVNTVAKYFNMDLFYRWYKSTVREVISVSKEIIIKKEEKKKPKEDKVKKEKKKY